MKKCIIILLLCFGIGNLSAQSPSRMSYQAVVRNASNALVVNAPVKMRITILQGAMATAVYSEQHNPTTNANGLASIEIGGGTSPSGSFICIDWSKGPFFIKTETDPANGNNYSITGTTQLLSVPYAMYTGDVNSSLSKTGDTLSIGSKRYVISGIRDVSGIGVSATGITSHTCGAINVHNPAIPYGTMTDQEGNVYRTVQIGTQIWMAENLKTTKYRNGVSIPNLIDSVQWTKDTIGAYCSYNNNTENDCPYGKLYNWYAVNNQNKLCPTGWHMPSWNEHMTLINFLGGLNAANGKLKSTGATYWESPNSVATNSSGFSGLPGGSFWPGSDFPKGFVGGGRNGYFWNNGIPNEGPWSYVLTREPPLYYVFQINYDKIFGLSVRCIKD